MRGLRSVLNTRRQRIREFGCTHPVVLLTRERWDGCTLGKFLKLCAVIAVMISFAVGGAREQEKIEADYVPASEYLPAFIAEEKGSFQKHTLDVQLTRVPLISNIRPAFLADDLQLGINTTVGFVQAIDGGVDLVIVPGGVGETGNTVKLAAAHASSIPPPKDLEGKKLCVPSLSSMLDVVVCKWVLDRGVDIKKVNIVKAGFRLQTDAPKSHQIDAAVAAKSLHGRMIHTGIAMPIANFVPAVAANQIGNSRQATRSWAPTHEKEIEEVRQALDHIAFARTDVDEALQIE